MPLPRCRPGFTDHIFKTSHGVRLPLRFWPPAVPSPSVKPPWLLWVHGGGYTCGKWSSPTSWISRAFAERGYAVVSVGYRLQPQADFELMVQDCADAVEYAKAHLDVDPARWVVGGASSGATLAAMLAHRSNPKVFVSVYGLVDTVHYLSDERTRPDYDEEYLTATEAEMEEVMKDRDLANAETQNPWADEIPPSVSLDECRAALGLPEYTPSEKTLRRVDMYTYVARHRNLMEIIYRRERFSNEQEFEGHVRANSPFHLLDTTTTFPPSYFLHGEEDNIVPTQQSRRMAETLRGMGIPTGEHYEKGAGHVYDFAFEIPADAGWKENVEPCLDFVDQHVKG